MFRKTSIYIFLLVTFFSIGINQIIKTDLFGEEKAARKSNKIDKTKLSQINEKNKIKKKSGNGKKIVKLDVNKVIQYLLKNNNDVKLALLDYKGASTDLLKFRGKYDLNLTGNVDYSMVENPNPNTTAFSGTSTTTGTYFAGIKKELRSGTTITAGVTGLYQNIKDAGIPAMGFTIGGVGYQTGISVSIKQELLKNFFGETDRLAETKIINLEKIKKQNVKMRLATLLVDALVGYWNVAIAQENLETSRINLKSTRNIQNLIRRKLRLGLSEREDILDWNGKVLVGMNNFDRSEKFLFDAKLAVLRTLNLDSGLEIEIGKTFKKTLPQITFEHAIKDAFLKRIDWNNKLIIQKNSELEYKIAGSNLLPSFTLSLSAGNKDYDTGTYLNTMNDINKEYSIGAELKYPLGNSAGKARIRNARLELQKRTVEKNELEKKIKDEITSLVKECEVTYKIYVQTLKVKGFTQNYYYQVLRKFKRGRYDALQLKLALDSFIKSRRDELKSLVDYNIALLRRDLARNMIFENFGIDIDSILKRVEN